MNTYVGLEIQDPRSVKCIRMFAMLQDSRMTIFCFFCCLRRLLLGEYMFRENILSRREQLSPDRRILHASVCRDVSRPSSFSGHAIKLKRPIH